MCSEVQLSLTNLALLRIFSSPIVCAALNFMNFYMYVSGRVKCGRERRRRGRARRREEEGVLELLYMRSKLLHKNYDSLFSSLVDGRQSMRAR